MDNLKRIYGIIAIHNTSRIVNLSICYDVGIFAIENVSLYRDHQDNETLKLLDTFKKVHKTIVVVNMDKNNRLTPIFSDFAYNCYIFKIKNVYYLILDKNHSFDFLLEKPIDYFSDVADLEELVMMYREL